MTHLFIEKYIPKTLDELNDGYSKILKKLSENNNTQSLIFYGPTGSGKKTRLLCFLQKIYGDEIYNINNIKQTEKINGRNVEIIYGLSKYHIDITPSMYGVYDVHIIHTLLIEKMKTIPITGKYRTIIINKADKLSYTAQCALRRIIELYCNYNKIIFITNNINKINDAIRSRSMNIRIAQKSHEEIYNILKKISVINNINFDTKIYNKIKKYANRDLRLSINFLQLYSFDIPLERYIDTYSKYIVKKIKKEPTLDTIISLREIVYDLIINCITIDDIIQTTCKIFVEKEKDISIKMKIYKYASQIDCMCNKGLKKVYYLECFLLHIAQLYSKE